MSRLRVSAARSIIVVNWFENFPGPMPRKKLAELPQALGQPANGNTQIVNRLLVGRLAAWRTRNASFPSSREACAPAN